MKVLQNNELSIAILFQKVTYGFILQSIMFRMLIFTIHS